jgi:hypothetical protein
MSDCTDELALDEDVVPVPPLEEAAEVDDGFDLDDAEPDDGHVDDPDEAASAVEGAHVDDAELDEAEVDDADVDDADVDGAGALEAWWRPLGIVTTWPA